MRCTWCFGELVEVDNPMRREVRHRRGEEAACPGPPSVERSNVGQAVVTIGASVEALSQALTSAVPALDIIGDLRCPLTELIRSQCAHCRPPAPVPPDIAELRAKLYRRRGWFPSRYGGVCRGCGDPFPPDTAVHRAPGDAQGYVAECCAEDGGYGPMVVSLDG